MLLNYYKLRRNPDLVINICRLRAVALSRDELLSQQRQKHDNNNNKLLAWLGAIQKCQHFHECTNSTLFQKLNF